MTEIVPLRPQDQPAWAAMWRDYLAFYETELPEARFVATFGRIMAGDGLHGFGAHRDGRLVGLTHYVFHPSTWVDETCYLHDLFVDPECRGGGVGRALITAVAEAALRRGAQRLYWHTRADNATARRLYDKVAQTRGSIRYDADLSTFL